MNKCVTGIRGLDELIGGGIPEGRIVLVIGSPGSGKTILAAQFLYKGIQENKENGVLVSLDESKDQFYSEMRQFGWDFAKAEQNREFALIEATRMHRVSMLKEELYKEETRSLRGKQLPVDKLIEEIQAEVQATKAKRVVVDTLAALFYRIPDPIERRTAVVDLIESLSNMPVTCIITTELGQLSLRRKPSEEEYLTHGVIMMQTLFSGGTTTRALQIEKLRGAKVNHSLVPYTIDKNGIEVFPNMPLFGGR